MLLAYYGDAVMELLTREKILRSGVGGLAAANRMSRRYITLEAQSDAYARIEDALSEEEKAVFRRGRNHSSRVPGHGSAAQYHRATGLEALFGLLWLKGGEERARELFEAAYPAEEGGAADGKT